MQYTQLFELYITKQYIYSSNTCVYCIFMCFVYVYLLTLLILLRIFDWHLFRCLDSVLYICIQNSMCVYICTHTHTVSFGFCLEPAMWKAAASPAACGGQHCATRGVRSASTQRRRRRRVDGRPSAILHILANLFGLKRKIIPLPFG